MNRFETPVSRIDSEGPDGAVIAFDLPLFEQPPRPGQFFMVKLLTPGFPLFGRALAVMKYREASGRAEIRFLVKAVGRGTSMICAAQPGDRAMLVGPLGNSFPALHEDKPTVLVAGGTGIAAFHYLFSQLDHASALNSKNLILLYGARNRSSLYLHDALAGFSIPMKISTDDGSEGKAGFVTELVSELLEDPAFAQDARYYVCGPDPMMLAVSRLCRDKGVETYLSLETRMACGTGICNGCAIEVERKGERVFQRVCHDGPVFPLHKLPAFLS